jgi:hypothetical protein
MDQRKPVCVFVCLCWQYFKTTRIIVKSIFVRLELLGIWYTYM